MAHDGVRMVLKVLLVNESLKVRQGLVRPYVYCSLCCL